jgi:Mce-associated membrane protein
MAEPAARRPARLPLAVLVLIVVALGVAVVVLRGQDLAEQGRADDRQAALDSAAAHAVDLMSLHYKTIDADVQRIISTSTGPARAAYVANSDKLKTTTRANKVVQHGVLRALGLVSLAGASARVLVVADVEIRWEGKKAPLQERFYRWSMELTKVGGIWLVSKAVQA